MAVTSQLTSLETFESAPTYNNIGSGGGAADNTDVFIEGAQSGGRRVDNATDKGFMATISSTDLSAAGEHVKIWVFCFHWSSVTGLTARIASGASAYDNHEFGTADIPVLGGWVPMWVDVSRAPDSTGTSGLTESAVTDIGVYIDIGNVGGAGDNFIIDEIQHGTSGYLWDGTGGDFGDFRTFEGTNVEGVFLSVYGSDICFARLEIGSATATGFTDSGFSITFPDQPLVASTFMGLTIDLQNASTAVNLDSGAIVSGAPATATNRPDLIVTGTSGTLDMDAMLLNGLRAITLTNACTLTNSVIANTGLITLAGADMSGSSVLTSTVAADEGAVFDDRTTTAATSITELNNCTFSQGTNAHHAIRFGANVDDDITLTGITFNGFDSTDDADGSTLRFDATTGSMNVNLVNCTVDGGAASPSNIGVDDAAGITVTLVIDPVAQTVNVKDTDGNNVQNARVFVETAATIAGGEIFEAGVTTLVQAAGVATCTMSAAHGLSTGDQVVIRGAQPDGYNKVATITVGAASVFTYSVDGGLSTPATGTPVVSYVPLHGLTNASGNITNSRTWGANQQLKGWARKKNASSPFFKDAFIAYTVNSTAGNTTNVVLQPDE